MRLAPGSADSAHSPPDLDGEQMGREARLGAPEQFPCSYPISPLEAVQPNLQGFLEWPAQEVLTEFPPMEAWRELPTLFSKEQALVQEWQRLAWG